MTRSSNLLFVSEVVNCMTEDRELTPREIAIGAERIWSYSGPDRSAHEWQAMALTAAAKIAAMRSSWISFYGTKRAGVVSRAENRSTRAAAFRSRVTARPSGSLQSGWAPLLAWLAPQRACRPNARQRRVSGSAAVQPPATCTNAVLKLVWQRPWSGRRESNPPS